MRIGWGWDGVGRGWAQGLSGPLLSPLEPGPHRLHPLPHTKGAPRLSLQVTKGG